MKKKIYRSLLLCACISYGALMAQNNGSRLSYALGVKITQPLVQEDFPLDKESFLQGVYDSLTGGGLKMSVEEIHVEIDNYMEELAQKRDQQLRMIAQKNKEEGDKLLVENKKKVGVVSLPNGIQYEVLSEGNKKAGSPGPKDFVTTHYRGSLADGSEFDSSYKRGEPIDFALDQVIPGWTAVLQMMSPGDKWKVVIPSHLAYGPHSPSNKIGPDRTLIFEIELLDYKPTK